MEQDVKTDLHKIIANLAKLQADVDYIKSQLTDEDLFLTEDEEKLLEESYKNEKKGKLKSSSQIKKELEIWPSSLNTTTNQKNF